MALDRFKKKRGVIALPRVTLMEFAQEYMKVSESYDMVPVASNLFPLFSGKDGEALEYQGLIFYEMSVPVSQSDLQPNAKKSSVKYDKLMI